MSTRKGFMNAPVDFDADISLTPEQYVIKELRRQLVERCSSLASGTTEMGAGMFVGYDASVQILDALCQTMGLTVTSDDAMRERAFTALGPEAVA